MVTHAPVPSLHRGPLDKPRMATAKLYTAPATPTAANAIEKNICHKQMTAKGQKRLLQENLTHFLTTEGAIFMEANLFMIFIPMEAKQTTLFLLQI